MSNWYPNKIAGGWRWAQGINDLFVPLSNVDELSESQFSALHCQFVSFNWLIKDRCPQIKWLTFSRVPHEKNPYSHISTNRGEKQLVPVEEGRHENVPIIKLVHKSLGHFSLSCPSGKLSLNSIVYLSSYLWSTRPLLDLEWQPVPQQTWDSLETYYWERKCLGF